MTDETPESKGIFGQVTSAVSEAAGYAVDSVKELGVVASDKTVSVALSQLMASMNYACKKIRDSDQNLPDDTKLIVEASVGVVSLSLEVPIKSIKEGDEEIHCELR